MHENCFQSTLCFLFAGAKLGARQPRERVELEQPPRYGAPAGRGRPQQQREDRHRDRLEGEGR